MSKVQDLRPSIGERGRAILGRIENARHIPLQLDRDYVIKGWLDRNAVSVLYGEPNTGKSFLALDIAHHVQLGRSWAGQRVRPGNVLYIAAEGGALFANRVAALDSPGFWVMTGALHLPDGCRESDSAPLADAIDHLAAMHGPFALIIFDTLARVMAGRDENAAQDIAALINATDYLRRRTGAHIMLVHHSGKDRTRGARGHSSLRAAVDTEIELTRDEFHLITAHATKQRDMQAGQQFAFRLKLHQFPDLDQDGDPVTTCTVYPEREEA